MRPRRFSKYPSEKPERENSACKSARCFSVYAPFCAALHAVTAAATYSGRFILPSILKLFTPSCCNSVICSISDRSLRLRSCPVPPAALKGRRHGWAQSPRLPLRAPSTALNRHCPETHMHCAPWTNTSVSKISARQSASISLLVSSRGSTARENPRSRKSRRPAFVPTLICVEACSSISGHIARTSRSTPRSCKISASAESRQTRASKDRQRGSSSSETSVLSVKCHRVP